MRRKILKFIGTSFLTFFLLPFKYVNSKNISEIIKNFHPCVQSAINSALAEIERKIMPNQKYVALYQSAYETYKKGHVHLRGLQ